jgi:hypothetical protein
LLSLAAAVSPAASFACGACVEDKIAATYDYAVVKKAEADHHLMVFGEIDGSANVNAVGPKIASAAARVRGIDRGTVRISASPPAFSFALDPAAQEPDAAMNELRRRLGSANVKLTVLRIAGGDSKTARK